MINKIPYEIVAFEADKLIVRMVLSPTWRHDIYNSYLNFIEACGWNDVDLDIELLRRIDANWDHVIWN